MLYNLPTDSSIWTFNKSGTTWQTWNKPSDFSNFMILAAAGGGGGGAGSYSGTNGGSIGAGGGGGGTFLQASAPAYLFPDKLFLQIGLGGAGGIGGASGNTCGSNVAGGTGGSTYISYYPNTNAGNLIFNLGGGGGGGGTGYCTNGGGVGGQLAAVTQSIFQYTSSSCNGQNGSGVPENSVDYSNTNCPILGGAAGGGRTNAISYSGASYPATFVNGKLSGGVWGVNSGKGNDGFILRKPFTVFGGTGGAGDPTFAAVVGPIGGSGVWGSGGGAGGGVNDAYSFARGGNGGRGGDGFVIIIGY